MKKLFALVLCGCVALSLFGLGTQEAEAIPAFKKEFDDMYVKKDSADPKEKGFAEAVAKVKCNVCHVGTKKKDKNAYGIELDKLLDKKADVKDAAKIQDALKKVAEMHSKPGDDSSPTYGDLIKEGKLPCEE